MPVNRTMPVWSDISDFTALPGTPLQQHPFYGAACQTWHRLVRAHCLGNAKRPEATAQVLSRYWPGPGHVALLSRGPVWRDGGPGPTDRAEAFLALLDQLRDQNRMVIVNAEDEATAALLAQQGFVQTLTPMHMAELDLSGDTARRRARLHGKWRNRLARAEDARLEVVVSPMRPQPGHWLLRKEHQQVQAKKYRRLPLPFVTSWARINPGSAIVLSAWEGRVPVAGVLLLMHAPTASYHIAWTSTRGRQLSAANLLLWRAMEIAVEKGATRMDLDSINTEDAPGLARFKLGTGATVRRLGGSWVAAPGTGLVQKIAGRLDGLHNRQSPFGQKA